MTHTFDQQDRSGQQTTDDPSDPAQHRHALQAAADLRRQAIQRMRYMSVRHAMHAWEHRYRDPLAPYGVAFLYAHPAARDGWWTLSAATRLWLAEPDTSDLPRLEPRQRPSNSDPGRSPRRSRLERAHLGTGPRQCRPVHQRAGHHPDHADRRHHDRV